MNPSEDPSDRLVDSLLREQAKDRPDEALLLAIGSRLQSKPTVRLVGNGGRLVRRLAAIAAVLAFGVWAATWFGSSGERSSTAESSVGAPIPDKGISKKLPEHEEDSTIDGNEPEPHRGPRIVRESDEAGTVADRRDLEQPMPRDGMMFARGVLWKGSKPLPEVYAHDPEAPGNPTGVKFEVSEVLGGRAQEVPVGGKTIVFTSSPDAQSVEDRALVIARHRFRDGYRTCTFVFLPAGGSDPAEPDWHLLVIDDSIKAFPPGSALVINLSPSDLRFSADKESKLIEAGERALFENLALDANISVSAHELVEDGWRLIYSSLWPPMIEGRTLIFVYLDQNGLRVTSFRDGTP